MAGAVIFFVEGQPQGKARPRFTRTGHPFTPKKTVVYEERIRDRFLEANGKKLPADCYVSISIRAVFEIPKSYTKQRKADCASGIERPAKKPDADNITKAVLDALNGVAYDDDKQVTSVRCTKWYTNSVSKLGLLERPGLVISVIEDKI